MWDSWNSMPSEGWMTRSLAVAAMLAASSISVGQTTQSASDREARLAARSAAKANESAAELFRTADTTYLVGDLARAGELYRQILTLAPNSVFTVRVTARL